MLMACEDIFKFHLPLQNSLLCNVDLFVFVVVFIYLIVQQGLKVWNGVLYKI